MSDKRNAIVYVMGGSYDVFTKYPTGMPTTEAHAKELVKNWKDINPLKRFAKYIIIDDVVNDTVDRAQSLINQGKPPAVAINQATSESMTQITEPTPTPSKLPWIIGGAGLFGLLVLAGVIYMVKNK